MQQNVNTGNNGRAKRPAAPRLTPEEEKAAKAVMRKMDKYSGKSEAELMREAARLAKKGKAEGGLDSESLNRFERGISAYLDGEQKRRLSKIMQDLKKELQ